MRALIQRVSRASVRLAPPAGTGEAETIARIGPGLVVLLGVAPTDGGHTADRLAEKIRALRVFADANGQMNDAVGEREILCVSQFTLYADTSRGNRPGFAGAAAPEHARPLYERVCERLGAARGRFGAHMEIELTADGPVTILLEVT
jgi:D-tyrosyl-tRNA(Tyr) deacylase